MNRKYHLLSKYSSRRLEETSLRNIAQMNINVLFPSFHDLHVFDFDLNSFSEIAMQKFFKPWLKSDFIFRRSSYAPKYEKSIKILQDFTMKVFFMFLL